ncbi:MAG: lysophospholipid acyltransferase family protein [Coraliomargaritaceae bacterium]
MSGKIVAEKEKPSGWSRLIAWLAATFLFCWWRTLRFDLDASARELEQNPPPPSLVLLWHNRLFGAPEIYRRFFGDRRLAALVSASGDGGWLAGFLRRLGIQPVRGSHHNRGALALMECLGALEDGCDIAITPDGSRGPVYAMKPGAAVLAVKTGAPVYLVDFRYLTALRLASWDRFFLPLPFSRVEVSAERVVLPAAPEELAQESAARELQARMDALISDQERARMAKLEATSERPVS